jgi:hypothetical protein
MDALIKRIKDVSGNTRFEVFKKGDLIAIDYFPFTADEEDFAFTQALKLARNIENDVVEESIVYKTGVQPIDFFMAANMNENELNKHLKNIKE